MIPTILDRWPDLRQAQSVVWMWLVEDLQALCGDVPDGHLLYALRVSLEALATDDLQTLGRQWQDANNGHGVTGLASASGAPHHRPVAEFLAREYLARAEELMQDIVDHAAEMAHARLADPADCWLNARTRIQTAADEFTPNLPGLSECLETFTSHCTRRARSDGT